MCLGTKIEIEIEIRECRCRLATNPGTATTTIELLVSSNSEAETQPVIERHVRRIWELLQEIRRCRFICSVDTDAPTETEIKRLNDTLETTIIKSSYARIQYPVQCNTTRILSLLPNDTPNRRHPINRTREYLQDVYDLIMKEDNRPRPRPDDDDDHRWKCLCMTLKAAGSAITELTAQHWVSGRCRDLRDFPTCTALMGEYVASIEDVRTLRHAALLPNCQAIFEAEMRIVCLPRETAKVQLPQSADEWNEVIKKALGWLNRPKLGVSRLTIDPEVVRNDCLQLSGDQEDRAADIHPEIKVLLHLYRINKNKTIKTSSSLPAFGYIGISKLSCLGCSIFISTFNDVLHTRFPTQGIETGRYSKCRYFPWAFPLDGCPDLANTVAVAYGKLVNHWGPSYDGFVLERRRFAADSIEEPSLLPQDPGDKGVEEWLEQEEERMARKTKADRLDG